jgi:hypothetical protein
MREVYGRYILTTRVVDDGFVCDLERTDGEHIVYKAGGIGRRLTTHIFQREEDALSEARAYADQAE